MVNDTYSVISINIPIQKGTYKGLQIYVALKANTDRTISFERQFHA